VREVVFRSGVLRSTRGNTGMTQVELAERVGVAPAAVRSWERGVDQPTAANVSRLAAALGVDARDFYEAISGPPMVAVLRHAAGLSLMELATRSGLAYSRCRRIEKGTVRPTRADVAALSKGLGVTAAELRRALGTAADDQKAAAVRKAATRAGP
jgi:transcriptional regulator with XRE-family HTH domain